MDIFASSNRRVAKDTRIRRIQDPGHWVKYISAGTSNQQNDKMPLDKQMTRGFLSGLGKNQGRDQDGPNILTSLMIIRIILLHLFLGKNVSFHFYWRLNLLILFLILLINDSVAFPEYLYNFMLDIAVSLKSLCNSPNLPSLAPSSHCYLIPHLGLIITLSYHRYAHEMHLAIKFKFRIIY